MKIKGKQWMLEGRFEKKNEMVQNCYDKNCEENEWGKE